MSLVEESKVCRICGLGKSDSSDELMKPCHCRGRFSFAHPKCISEWVTTTRHLHCDICRFKYKLTKWRISFLEWIFEYHRIDYLLQSAIIITFVYYVSALGMISAYQVSRENYSNKFMNLIRSLVLSSSYFCIIINSLSSLWLLHQLYLRFKLWREENFLFRVTENTESSIEVDTDVPPSLTLSGYITSGAKSKTNKVSKD